MSKKDEEYYPKINNLLNTIAKNIKNNAVKEPLDKIRNTINPTRHLNKLLKNYKNQEQRKLQDKMRNLLQRWRKNLLDEDAKKLNTRMKKKKKIYLNENDKKKL